VPLVIYGVWSETSIGALFVAGIVPGLLLAGLFSLALLTQRRRYPPRERRGARTPVSRAEIGGGLSIAAVFGIVIGGIYSGVFTPTEASGIGAAGVVLVAAAAGRFSTAALKAALAETVRMTATIFMILIGGVVFSRFLVQTRLTEAVVGAVTGLDVPPELLLVALALLYLVLGAVMDTFGMLILTLPLVLPVTVGLGYHPVWTGIYLTILMEIAMLTPPIGLNVFVLERATGVPSSRIFAGIWPFVAAALALVGLMILFPGLALWLPGLG